MSKRIIVILSVVLALVMAAGCGGSASSTDTPAGQTTATAPSGQTAAPVVERSKTVTIGTNSKPTTLDPNNFRDYGSQAAINMTYETLIASTHVGDPYRPYLAKSWDIAPDGKSWTFQLQEGVLWNNGDPFTADDVVFTVQRLVDNKDTLVVYNQYLPDLESAEKIDELTVKVNFSKPTPLAGNGFRCMFIIPQKAYEEYGDDLFNKQIMVGTGPWMLEEWVDGQYTHYLKNENYWDKANYDSYFDEVYVRYVVDDSAGVAAHLAGSFEAYFTSAGLSTDMTSLYDGAGNKTELRVVESNSTVWLGLNFKEGSIWHDENIRKAFDASIDRQLILDTVMGGGAIPNGYLPANMIGSDATLPKAVYDPDLAKELLADSSYDGREFGLMIGTNTTNEQLGLALADMANAVGFNMKVELTDLSVFTPRQNSGDYDFFLINTAFPDGLPLRQLNRVVTNLDKSGYQNDELFGIINHFLTELDETKRFDYAKQANRFIFENKGPQISLFTKNVITPVDWGIIGVTYYPDGLWDYIHVDYDPSLIP
ncbi:MAG: ABC transporter substrate-binding protein [Peptococcaceae bacterium]|jgi:peptide/nickel transport system substrate-binding protein|nr:ABC transporter substrate-binding protein [Peptococcaceae bacterium]